MRADDELKKKIACTLFKCGKERGWDLKLQTLFTA
jgi:hypothetical protein